MNLPSNFYTLPQETLLLMNYFLDVDSRKTISECSRFANCVFSSGKSKIEMLDKEMLFEVTKFLNPSEIKAMSSTSKKLRKFVMTNTYFNIPFHIEKLEKNNPFHKLVLNVTRKTNRDVRLNLQSKKEITVCEEVYTLLSGKKISISDINELCEWDDIIAEEADSPCSSSREITLELCMQALFLKKEFSNKYPNNSVQFNSECTSSDTLYPTRNWLLIDGINAKKYEENI